MTMVHLLIEDDYVEDFMNTLPKDKITVIEEDFKSNQHLLENELQKYSDDKSSVIPYYESMKELGLWLNEKEL